MKNTTIGVDLAKSVFEVAVSERPGQVSLRKRLSRSQFLVFFAERQVSTVVMEACGTAHYWARQLQSLGHRVVLLPPHTVRPYIHGNKTDRCDAKGILEAFRNDGIKPVPVKTVNQHALVSLHRLRSAWNDARTARINTLRGLLRELGIVIPVGAHHLRPQLATLLEDADSPIPMSLREPLFQAGEEIRALEQRIRSVEKQLRALALQMPTVQRLQTIPGIGLLTATALVAFVGDVQRFSSGRRFASYLGLTPREHSSGMIRHLGAISKRGNTYLRMLLTHGARSVLWSSKRPGSGRPDRLRAWALKLQNNRGHNKAIVAVANKLARITWAVWRKEKQFSSAEAA